MKKALYLFLALMLPGLIFVYLKFGAKNEFAIPVFYDKGVTEVPTACQFKYPTPYLLPDSLWEITGTRKSKANLIVFSKSLTFDELYDKIHAEFDDESVWITDADDMMADSAIYRTLKNCIFLVKEPWQVVLYDDEGKIRGYYNPVTLEEMDRLRVELKILLKKY